MEFEPVIGLEIHAELQTRSKMFCPCPVVDSTTAEPNRYVCPVCAGMPGTLPVPNQRAIEWTILTGLALNCEIAEYSLFYRKNYFYPDLPSEYQRSMYDYPLCLNGYLEIDTPTGTKRVRIRRVHIEEDTGKLIHVGGATLVDFNRAGVPLMEIVTEPDMHSVEEVKAFAIALRTLLRYLRVNSGDMEKGVIRFEANVSVRPKGETRLGTRTEIKNLNSFRALVRAVEYEIRRQIEIVRAGGQVEQETMGWDEARGVTVPQRGKEHAHDYRYFPEPDIPPLAISREWVERIRAMLPELPRARRERFEREYGLTRYEADLLTEDHAVADYFEEAVRHARQGDPPLEPRTLATWITGELFRLMNEAGVEIGEVRVPPTALVDLIRMVQRGEINLNTGKMVLREAFETGEAPRRIVEARGLTQIRDVEALRAIVLRVIEENPREVESYLRGKEGVLKWFVGQVMRATRGQADPQRVNELVREALEARRSAGPS
ncbi:Asp-tRNA(Asn)/Glu-tRNA(Gln) amidotransferase subunit GatB [Thermoflexus hugenholtzii]|uniref:Aspartyl/glutamyl-tRNA(Asn/Gln) amidotransferase subunit B n=1 Tax=Thermoflexus hugenholtzii JAD2 TaxID=877466 RepID=A0A212QQ61_9CHLR|nr:Asp-tRNA(Asn)/Glu-tRNA(Gln) amidotransferase subunit GatB [Thermoflexus hugenholtzii]SNB61591.1 aspartyl/glutamyl-tRNA(Asn/Gln) amidotransferase subunit B [Thermoflexus hugenholtzii JAD2]